MVQEEEKEQQQAEAEVWLSFAYTPLRPMFSLAGPFSTAAAVGAFVRPLRRRPARFLAVGVCGWVFFFAGVRDVMEKGYFLVHEERDGQIPLWVLLRQGEREDSRIMTM